MRSVFVIGPDKKIKLMMTYPMTNGRNFDEILRALDSMQLTAKHKALAGATLRTMGFQRAVALLGGMKAWGLANRLLIGAVSRQGAQVCGLVASPASAVDRVAYPAASSGTVLPE